MDGISSLDLMTRRFGSGVVRLALWLVSLWRGTPEACGPLLTLLMDGISSPDPMTTRLGSGVPRLVLWLANLWRGTLIAPHRIAQYMSIFMHSQTRWVGSQTQRV